MLSINEFRLIKFIVVQRSSAHFAAGYPDRNPLCRRALRDTCALLLMDITYLNGYFEDNPRRAFARKEFRHILQTSAARVSDMFRPARTAPSGNGSGSRPRPPMVCITFRTKHVTNTGPTYLADPFAGSGAAPAPPGCSAARQCMAGSPRPRTTPSRSMPSAGSRERRLGSMRA